MALIFHPIVDLIVTEKNFTKELSLLLLIVAPKPMNRFL